MYSWKVKKSVWYYIMSNDENVNFQCYASRLDCITGQWSLLSRPERGCHLKFTREVYSDVTIKDAGILVGFVIYIWRRIESYIFLPRTWYSRACEKSREIFSWLSYIMVMTEFDALRDLLPFVQFKKRGKHS